MGGGRRGGAAVIAALLLFACVLAAAPVASASEFTVDSTADGIDAVPGDESCLTVGGKCTLRAAIEEANSLEEFGTIQFEEGMFEGGAAATIALAGSLPTVTVPLFINGRTCETAAGVSGPCVGIDGAGGEPALTFDNVEEVQVWGLAITGAQTAIRLESSPRAKIQASWFGIGLDGSPGGNATGVLVGPGSNRSLIGGEGAEPRDVFVDSAGDGLDIHGAGNVRVFGNYFGVEPDGVTPRTNGEDDIEVASTGGFEATGTAIGTRVAPAATVSPQCDGGCNVISGAASNGVDLAGDGALEAPAASTDIAGNYIGLDAAGTTAIPNAGAGVRVGEAAHTVIGGPSAGETNRIAGGSAGVLAGPAAGDLSIRGNLIGTDATGADVLAPPDDGIVVDSAELPSPTVEAEIAGNQIGMEGGVAISQRGQGAWIFDNRIFGAQIGIKTFESSEYGNVIEGNLIEDPTANGVLVENNLNEILGNAIFGAGGAGIWIQGALLQFGVSGNLIGGDMAEDENFISGSAGAAIEISNIEATGNEVARNRGAGNGGAFIDLVAASPGSEVGPNRGIPPPTFSTATPIEASGGAEEGATVRVFRKQLAAAGELESFLGEAVADSSGGWKVTYDGAVPAGTIVAATQTEEGATSELAIATIPGSEGTSGGSAGGAFGSGAVSSLEGEIARIRPQTKILAGVARSHTARFVFKSSQAGSIFLCRLDGRPFDLCGSPKRYVGLGSGKHVFWVRAVDSSGRVDLSPAKKKFVVPG
jgi:CSLREA domain-containing protein